MKTFGIAIVIAMCVYAGSALGKTCIVKDGQPRADIVIADTPLRQLAADSMSQ